MILIKVRAAAKATLNTFVKETALKDMFVNEIFSSALAKVSCLNCCIDGAFVFLIVDASSDGKPPERRGFGDILSLNF